MNEYAENLPEDLARVARALVTAHSDGALLVAISKAARQIVPAAEYVSVVASDCFSREFGVLKTKGRY
ncbi:UNVERIFIED_CONTAM: hypothetical protein DES50_1112 [Williamsia faeni]